MAVILLGSVGASPKEQAEGLKSSSESPLVHALVHCNFTQCILFRCLWIGCDGSLFSSTNYLFTPRYIRIVGTHNTVNKIFHIVAFECMFTNKTFTLEKGLIGKYCNYVFYIHLGILSSHILLAH